MEVKNHPSWGVREDYKEVASVLISEGYRVSTREVVEVKMYKKKH